MIVLLIGSDSCFWWLQMNLQYKGIRVKYHEKHGFRQILIQFLMKEGQTGVRSCRIFSSRAEKPTGQVRTPVSLYYNFIKISV